MARAKIDTDKLYVYFHTLRKDDLLDLLERAVDLLPRTRIAALVEGYVDLDELKPESKATGRLLEAVKAFDAASRRGEYYQDFNVNSRNFMDMSRGTETWIAECNRLLDRCAAAAGRGKHAEAREAFELIFDLLRDIDACRDDIIFFADEAGSWQVGVDWEAVLPSWLGCLAETAATPETFAEAAIATIDELDSYDRDKHLKAARRVASPAQRKALQDLARQSVKR